MKSQTYHRKKHKIHFLPLIFLLLLAGGAAYYVLCLNRLWAATPLKCSAKSEGDLRVATINIARFSMMKSARYDAEFLYAAMIKNDVDILVIQEYAELYQFSFSDFREIFLKDYPYIRRSGEQAIVSRTPFEVEKNEDFDMEYGSYASYALKKGKDVMARLVSVHLHTTGLSAMRRSGDPDAVGTAMVMNSNRKVRIYQADSITKLISGSDCPVIVAGDFNSMPYSKVYRNIRSAGLQDSFLKKGLGNGSTFRAFKNLLRIDYILPDNNFTVKDHLVCDDPLSDHRMVISTLKLSPEQ